MFLNSTPLQYTPRAFYTIDNSLIDNDVNYYNFVKSKEYQDVYNNSLSSDIQTAEAYFSPYFGLGDNAYRELDKVYEAYKLNLPIDITQPNPNVKRVTSTTSAVNPALILAAAAAFFFAR